MADAVSTEGAACRDSRVAPFGVNKPTEYNALVKHVSVFKSMLYIYRATVGAGIRS